MVVARATATALGRCWSATPVVWRRSAILQLETRDWVAASRRRGTHRHPAAGGAEAPAVMTAPLYQTRHYR